MIKRDLFGLMWSENSTLFSDKEDYLLTHTTCGKNRLFQTLSNSEQRKLRCDNLHLLGKIRKFTDNGIPILQPYNPESLPYQWFSYRERSKHGTVPWGVHFFLPDYQFKKAITSDLERTTMALSRCDVVMTPDCSLYVDLPTPYYNYQNIYHTRFAGAYWQSCGFNVIQTASWGDADSLKYCFEGLAENSVTAISGIGHNRSSAARLLWTYAIKELLRQKSPTKLIVYGGREDDILELGIPVIFISDYISKHFRNHEKK